MIYTVRDHLDETKYTFDIAIIGSGSGGAMSAAKLSEMGYRVVVLEEGPYVTQKDFDQDSQKLVPRMYRRGGGLATDDFSVRILQGRVYGGSPTINWMTCLRTPDFVLDQWVDQFGLTEYNTKDMEKHFEAIEKRLNVTPVPDDDHNPQNSILIKGGKKLGIKVNTTSNNAINCIGCGTCGLGCPYNAKQDMRLTYLKDARANGITVFTDTRVDKIDYKSKDSQVVHATIFNKEFDTPKMDIELHVNRTVVSAGAIYTPLILQKSGLTKGGLVGKNLQIHPVTASFALYDEIIDPTYGIPQSVHSDEYQNLDGKGYGFWLEVPDLEPFLMAVNFPGAGVERRNEMKKMRNYGSIIVLVRDGANQQSTVSNGEVKWKRGFNMQNGSFNIKPVPSIRYKLSKEDKVHLLKGLENSIEMHFAAGAKKVFALFNKYLEMTSIDEISQIYDRKNGPNQISLYTAHPTGTARMGPDPKTSVVNPKLEMHYYPGVYVMDGSILTTSPGVNPMITILSTISRAFELIDKEF